MRPPAIRFQRAEAPPAGAAMLPMGASGGAPAVSQVHSAYLAIEYKIVTLEFRPGSMLTARDINQAVGFGRTPVREAIQRLTLEGLMEVHPRLGVRIATIRPEDYPRAVEPRLTLEPLLARSAARYAGPREREMVAACMHEMLACARRDDVVGFLEQDKALDEAISRAAANPFLPRVLAPLQIHSRRFWYHYHGADGLADPVEGHAAVCRAISAGDPQRAFDATRALMDYLFAQSKAL